MGAQEKDLLIPLSVPPVLQLPKCLAVAEVDIQLEMPLFSAGETINNQREHYQNLPVLLFQHIALKSTVFLPYPKLLPHRLFIGLFK